MPALNAAFTYGKFIEKISTPKQKLRYGFNLNYLASLGKYTTLDMKCMFFLCFIFNEKCFVEVIY